MLAALGFLTVLGGHRQPHAGASAWFGPVGALLGLAVGGAWWVGTELWNPLVGAALALAVDVVLTGALHLDGVADSADGLLPHLDRQRRLEVMAAPDVGAFGVVAVATLLLLRLAALTALAPHAAATAALWGASRAGMALALARVPYARGQGLASAFSQPTMTAPLAWLVAAVALAMLAAPGTLAGALAVPALLGAGGGVVWLARRRLGGHTGDVLGAAGVVGETVGLLVIGLQW